MTPVLALAVFLAASAGADTLWRRTAAQTVRPPATAWDGVYTAAQATRGAAIAGLCVTCHGVSLDSSDGDAPALVGPAFAKTWNGWTLGDMFERVVAEVRALKRASAAGGTAAPAGGEVESRQQSADVLAYLLLQNRFPRGQTELPPDIELLRRIRFVAAKP